MPTAAVMIADGSEEMEAVIIVDTLRRAGLDVDLVSIKSTTVLCSRQVSVMADMLYDPRGFSGYDAIVLPGGMGGTEAFMADSRLLDTLVRHHEAGKLLCAICAAPLVLQAAGISDGKRVTCHPAVSDRLAKCTYTGNRIEKDGNIVTSQGPGTAFEFALEIITMLKDEDAARTVRDGLVL